MTIAIGMSGYAYKEWKGSFYPDTLKADDFLGHYASRFATVEINNTFYRLPREHVVAHWAEQVPDGFSFTLKASRRITHDARLKEAETAVGYLLKSATALGTKRGPTLFQLPPTMKKDAPRLAKFLKLLPARWRAAFEFRHASWFDDETYDLLRGHDAALVVAEDENGATPVVATATWGYLRLRNEQYDEASLAAWADRIRAQAWTDAFVYLKHGDHVTPADGLRLQELLA